MIFVNLYYGIKNPKNFIQKIQINLKWPPKNDPFSEICGSVIAFHPRYILKNGFTLEIIANHPQNLLYWSYKMTIFSISWVKGV